MTAFQNIKIDSGVPIPKRDGSSRAGKWRLLAMEMRRGDSVLLQKNEAAGLYTAMRKLGFKSIRRSEGNLFRVWKGKKID